MIVSTIVIMICVSIGSVITQKLKFKQESSVTIAFLGIALFLYISGLINLMKYAVYTIYIIALISFGYTIYNLIKKKIEIKQIITPGIIVYSIVLLIMTFIAKDTYYIEWDEFSHWGANLKAMVEYDLFWSNNIYDGVHVVYTPIAGIVEYFFCKVNGRFAEDISYIAINTFIITLLLPVCKNEKYSIKGFLKLILFWITVYCTIILCNFKICSIYIDLLLGILFATGMYLSFRLDGMEDKINLALLLISMPLLKDSGLLLMGIILMQLVFSEVLLKIIEEKKITKQHFKTFGIILLMLIIPLIFYGTWKVYCKFNDRVLDDRHDKNAISEIDIKQYIKGLMLLETENTKYKDIAKSFYTSINTANILGNDGKGITAIKVLIILDIIGFYLYGINKDDEKKKKILTLLLAFNIGFVLYCLLLLATFMFAFTDAEGLRLASYDRYMNTYFIAWIIATIGIAVENKKKNQLIITIICILLCIYSVNIINLVNVFGRKGVSLVSEEINKEANIIKEKVNFDDKVYLIYQGSGGIEFFMLRYCISPIVTNLMYEWSLGPAYYDGFICSYDITKEEFVKKLLDEEFDYVFFANVDEQFKNIYGNLINYDFSTGNIEELNNKLLKIEKINENEIVLNLVD